MMNDERGMKTNHRNPEAGKRDPAQVFLSVHHSSFIIHHSPR
jgi:hypothetical protein